MKKAVTGYGLALAVALVAAYQTWTHEGDADLSEATVILKVDREDLEAIDYEGPSVQVHLEMREDALGSYVWVESRRAPAAKPGDPQDPDAPAEPAEPADAGTPETFKAGAAGEQVAERMAPFVAKRVLEGVDEAKLEELGFGDEQSTLTLHRRAREPQVYEVGAKAYGGSNRYVRDPADGVVYIVAADLIDTLETASRTLPDRSLIGGELSDIESITVRGGEASVTYAQNNPDDDGASFWSREGASEPSPAAAGWFDKALRLRVSRYLAEGEQPAGLEEAFSMSIQTAKTSTQVVVFRAFSDGGEEQFYATSPHNRAMVQLQSSSAAEAQADLGSVLEGGA